MNEINGGSHDMDEITMIRTLLAPPPPPHPQVTAHARQRLAERTGGRRVPAPLVAHGRSRRARWAMALSGVAVAGLAGALAVTTLVVPRNIPHGQAGQGRGGLVTSERPFGVLTGQPAHPFLVALATRVAQSTTTGKYWCYAMVTAGLDAIGPGGKELTPAGEGETPSPVSDYRYSIDERTQEGGCQDPSNVGHPNIEGYVRQLGAQPATAKDAAAWRNDGSPAWHAWYGNGQLIPSQTGPRKVYPGKPGHPGWGSPASLPADPAKLRALLLAGFPGPNDPSIRMALQHSGETYTEFRNANLWGYAMAMLQEPLSPAVRAAAYQVMASVPGVHMQPGVTDPSGRNGTALWIGTDTRPRFIAIVDPATGMLLADEFIATQPHGVYAPGTLTQYNLWISQGWASQLPAAKK